MINLSYILAGAVSGLLIGCFGMYIYLIGKKDAELTKRDHDRQYLAVMNQWFLLKQHGLQAADWLLERKIERIAVYGMGLYGRHLIRELAGSGVLVSYGIDRGNAKPYEGIPVVKPGDMPEQVDAVVNTVVWAQSELVESLAPVYRCEIISLEEIVFERFGMKRDSGEDEK